MRILHLSDLHARESDRDDIRRLIGALLRDLASQTADAPPDLIVFSGDLAFSGDEAEYYVALEDFILPMLKIWGLPLNSFFIAKGNHDIVTARINADFEDGIRQKVASSDGLNDLLQSRSETLQTALQRSENWSLFESMLFGEKSIVGGGGLGTAKLLTVGDLDVGVVVLDSAWRSTGAPNDGDRNQLVVGERQWEPLLDSISESDFKIATMHHPLDWLAAWDAQNLERDLRNAGVRLLLTGHTHLPQSAAVLTSNSLITVSAGAIFQGRRWATSYNILDVSADLSSVDITVRRYEEARDVYVPDTSVADGGHLELPLYKPEDRGVKTTSLERRSRAGDLQIVEAARVFDEIALGVLENNPIFVGHRQASDIAPVELAARLIVPPVLLDVPYAQWLAARGDRASERPERAQLDEFLTDGRTPLLIGDPGSGVSTALDWVLLNYAPSLGMLPIRLNAAELNLKSKAKFASSVDQSFFRTFGGVPASEAQMRLVAVEGLRNLSRQKLETLFERIAETDTARFVLSCDDASTSAVREAASVQGSQLYELYIGQFGRKEIRTLVDAYGLGGSGEFTDTVTHLLGHHYSSRLPFMICALIAVAAENLDLVREGNDSEILEKYLRLLLSRDLPVNLDGTDFDFQEREYFLVSFALEMISTGVAEVERGRAIELFNDLLLQLRRRGNPMRVLDSLQHRGVLAESFEGKVVFRQNEVLNVVLARGAVSYDGVNDVVAKSVFDYPNVTRHRAGLSRSNRALLADAVEQVRNAANASEGGDLDTYLTSFRPDGAEGVVASDDDADSTISRIERRDEANAFAEDLQDQLWETMESSTPSNPVKLTPLNELSATGRKVRLASLLSYVLRGTDLVTDSALREEALVLALELWTKVADAWCADESSRDSFAEGLRTSGLLGDPDLEKTKERSILASRLFPLVVTHFSIRSSMGNPKLSGQVEALREDSRVTASTAVSMFFSLFNASLRVPGWISVVRESWTELRENVLAGEMIYRLCNGIYTNDAISDSEATELAKLLADMLTFRERGRDDHTRSAEILQRLEKTRLQQLFRAKIQPSTASE